MNTIAELNDSLIGRYLVEKEVGQGGMATVYLARDVRHDRKVAIKVLHPELAAVLGPERFVTEMKVTANLQHPHILPLFDSGSARNQLFYVMPFVEGESLRDRLNREQQLPIDEAIRITTQVASALDYAHRHGVVHRDIKPENILLHDGTALVADFGIALAVSNAGGTRLTQTGLSLGTPQYMSPEQATGDRNIDGRTDVYSLGCVLYEMLTGEPPFSGTSAQAIVARVLTETVRPMRPRRDTISGGIEAAVLKAVQKIPADRFATPAEFSTALTSPTAAFVSATAPRRGIDWRIALLGGAIAGAAVMFLAGGRRGAVATAAGAAGRRQQLTFNGRTGRPAVSPDGNWVAYVNTTCKHVGAGLCQSDLLVQEVGSTQAVPILQGATALGTPTWNHDGTQIVVGGSLDSVRNGVFVIPRTGGVARLIGPPAQYATHPSADTVVLLRQRPDGQGTLLFVNPATGAVVDSAPHAVDLARDISWSPDGKHFATVNSHRGISIFSRDGRLTDSVILNARRNVRWTASGHAVLLFKVGSVKEDELVSIPVGGDGRIGGRPVVLVPRVPTLYLGEFDVARQTGRIVFATGDALTDLWTFDIGNPEGAGRQRTRGTTWYGSATISPDGSALYYGRGDALGDNAYMLNLKDDTEEPLTAQNMPFGSDVHIATDGRRITFGHADEKGQRLDVLALPSRQPTSQVSAGVALDFWPIGNHGYLNGTVDGRSLAVLDTMPGTWRMLPAPDSMRIVRYAPSPDGTRAVVLFSTRHGYGIGTTPLSGWQLTPVASGKGLPGTPRSVTWEGDGNIYLTLWRDVDDKPTLWRVAESGGALARVTALPTTCDLTSVTLSLRAKLGSCTAQDDRSDAWIIDGVGN